MSPLPPSHRCRLCGATSYRKLTHRGPDGIMGYSGEYRCSGCSFTFSDPGEWRERRLRPRREESLPEEEQQHSA
jgi:hypothetical protein